MNDIERAQEVTCPKCEGRGGERWAEPDGSERGERCDLCDGFGHVPAEQQALGAALVEEGLAYFESVGDEGDQKYIDAIRAALAARQPSIIEQIAQQWDGCNFDSMGETIDIGDAIRRAGKRLQTEALSQPQAEQQGAGYASRAEFETWLAPIWSREGQVDADGDFVYNNEWVQGAWIGYQAALAALAARQLAATERNEDGWIDVSERKPEHAQEVLFVLDGKTVAGAWIGGIFWYSNQKRAALWWQPFPKPRIGAAAHPRPAAPDSQPVGDYGQPMVLVSREFKLQAEHDTQIASDVANLLRDNKIGLSGSQPEMVAALLKIAARPPAGQEPMAWATHHDEPMLFLTFAEAAAYCDDDEPPIALFTAAPAAAAAAAAAVPEDVRRDAERYRFLRRADAWQENYINKQGAISAIYVSDGSSGHATDLERLDAAIDAAMLAARPEVQA